MDRDTHRHFSDTIQSGDTWAVTAIIRQHPELINHPDWTPPPLHCAVLWNQPKIVEILLDNGAEIEMLDPDRKTSPLRYAIVYCQKEKISLLLARGANTGPIAPGGTTALELAQECVNGAYKAFDDLPPLKFIMILSLSSTGSNSPNKGPSGISIH